MKGVVLFSDSGKIAEALFYSPFFELKLIICEKGKLSGDLLNFSYLRSVPVFEAINNGELFHILLKNKIDIAIMYGFGIILNRDIIDHLDIYNIHPGKLPDYKGRHPTFFATINGDKSIYYTLHKVVEEIDSGEIIGQVKMDYYYWQDENDVKKFLFQAFLILIRKLHSFLNGKSNSSENKSGKYFKTVTKSDKILDPKLPIKNLLNIVRAQATHGGAIFIFKGKEYLVQKIQIVKYDSEYIFEDKIVLNLNYEPIGIKIDNSYFVNFELITSI